ncbi:stage V sporulation protein AE [Shouchella shacheensis]|uniref:stage V sporulation protein AE n=1 Tax=Shouchella shacheensis TaxID=1649580 RepID=UPI00073FC822|nr:stage V sporulation protein AE [Shouchella shacheensis]
MKQVIFVTDGDLAARHAIEHIAEELGCFCISASAGNPSMLTEKELCSLVLQAPDRPIFVMFDDCGYRENGPGEKGMRALAHHPDIHVLGAVAVASATHAKEWAHVDVSIDRFGELTAYGVDKEGLSDMEIGRINGDTVYVLDELDLPIVVGIGDIGKMARFDDIKRGAPITKQAIELIFERSGYRDR